MNSHRKIKSGINGVTVNNRKVWLIAPSAATLRREKHLLLEKKNNDDDKKNDLKSSSFMNSIVSAPWNVLKWIARHPKQILLLILAAKSTVMLKHSVSNLIDFHQGNSVNKIEPPEDFCNPQKLMDEQNRILDDYFLEVRKIQEAQE